MTPVPDREANASSDEIRIAFTLTKADYLRAYRRNFWRTLWWLILSAPLIATSPVWRDPYFRFCFMHGYFSGPAIVGSGPTHYVLIPFDRLDSDEIKIRLHRLLKDSLGARASKI